MPDKNIREFYQSGSFLLVGMSKKKRNMGWAVYKSFIGSGRKVFPLHPGGGEKDGVKFYSRLEELPEIPEACVICADLKQDREFIPMLADSGVKRFWFQWGSYDSDLMGRLREIDMTALTGCALMYLPGASFPHNVHRFFHELFAKGRS